MLDENAQLIQTIQDYQSKQDPNEALKWVQHFMLLLQGSCDLLI